VFVSMSSQLAVMLQGRNASCMQRHQICLSCRKSAEGRPQPATGQPYIRVPVAALVAGIPLLGDRAKDVRNQVVAATIAHLKRLSLARRPLAASGTLCSSIHGLMHAVHPRRGCQVAWGTAALLSAALVLLLWHLTTQLRCARLQLTIRNVQQGTRRTAGMCIGRTSRTGWLMLTWALVAAGLCLAQMANE
jgi:hypothetical protein